MSQKVGSHISDSEQVKNLAVILLTWTDQKLTCHFAVNSWA